MLSLPQFKVKLEGQGEYLISIINGDQVQWDLARAREKWPDMSEASNLWASYICWVASRRKGNFQEDWNDWLSKVEQVEYVDSDEAKTYAEGTRSRLVVEIALATRTAPSQWWDETDEVLATALEILTERAK